MYQKIIRLPPKQKIYFASDFHLGAPNHETSLEREKRIIKWLDQIKESAHSVYLLGDIFDFWFEYKQTIPKGFVRLQGKLAELQDKGISISLFTGNHDLWMFDYFPKEIGANVYHAPIELKVGHQTVLIGHGDGLGTGEKYYKMLKAIYQNSFCQWVFLHIPPNLGISFARYCSKTSRLHGTKRAEDVQEKREEKLFTYCAEIEKSRHYDYYIFGHRHLPLDLKINEHSRYINLGDWIQYNTYAVYDGNTTNLIEFNP